MEDEYVKEEDIFKHTSPKHFFTGWCSLGLLTVFCLTKSVDSLGKWKQVKTTVCFGMVFCAFPLCC